MTKHDVRTAHIRAVGSVQQFPLFVMYNETKPERNERKTKQAHSFPYLLRSRLKNQLAFLPEVRAESFQLSCMFYYKRKPQKKFSKNIVDPLMVRGLQVLTAALWKFLYNI